MNIWLEEEEYSIRESIEKNTKNKYYTDDQFRTLSRELWEAQPDHVKEKFQDKYRTKLQALRAMESKKKVYEKIRKTSREDISDSLRYAGMSAYMSLRS